MRARRLPDAEDDDVAPERPAEGDDTSPDRPSKTQLKKASHELQDLGAALVEMPDDRLAALGMDESLRDAIREYRRTRSHEGRRRQMQYIGKLMRRADIEPLREAVAAMQLGRAKDALALHEAERWRAELIDSDDALTRWSAAHPSADLQQLRSLVRAARKDASLSPEQRSGRAYRDLFKFIRQHHE
ncbi:MAG TPA: ribosome biogenesis factor YjgA [Albitalea sp.]